MAIIEQHEQEATERYEKRGEEREKRQKEIKEKGIYAVDEDKRIKERHDILNTRDVLAMERILGNIDFLGVNFLEIGLKATRSVCRIQVRDRYGRIQGYGTGFMVSPRLIMTNNHVIRTLEVARHCLLDFQFEDDAKYIPRDTKNFVLDPDTFFFTDGDLDFTLVAVGPSSTDGTPLSDFGHLRLREESGKALLGEYVTIVQHPQGGTKQVALRENELVDIFDHFVHYSTDTMPGSSGSPVFNDQWEVVALHHSGVVKRNSNGKILTVDGKVWKPEMGQDKIAWVANEGVRISSIFKLLRERDGWSSEERDFIAELGSEKAAEGGPVEVVTEELGLEWYEGSSGYDPDFLGTGIGLPVLAEHLRDDITPLKDSREHELKYTHFSVVMSKSRRLAFYTAVNIDGADTRSIKRHRDKWYFDPRIDRKYQSGPELYSRNDLDRGHLVRRLDPVWGDQAREANEDTFHFTNCSPQHRNLNQRSWLDLEDYILKNADVHDLKVCVFTGPVFRADDMVYRGQFQVPAEFWKIAVMRKDDGKLSATAYLQTQKNLLENLEFAYGEYQTYQVQLLHIEALTGLDFGEMRDHDPLAGIEATMGRVITKPEDIRL